MNNWQSIKLVPPVPSKVIRSGLNALGHLFDTAPISDGQRAHWLTWSKDVRAMLTREEDATPATAPAVPIGYMNAGHLHEMQSGSVPYAYLYPEPDVGVSVPVYASTAPALPQEWISVADRLPDGEPGDPAIEFYNNDLRNPTRQVIGIYRDGVWLSGGHQFCNVTYWKPLTPAPVCEAGGEA